MTNRFGVALAVATTMMLGACAAPEGAAENESAVGLTDREAEFYRTKGLTAEQARWIASNKAQPAR